MIVGVLRDYLRLRLISLRGGDVRECPPQIIAALHEVAGELIEQIGTPRLGLHGIDRMHDTVTHEAVPQTVRDGAREATVLRMCHQRG